ncbi:GBP2 Serine/arginine [Candida maltosa Xu316]|uniref:Single-strand telomeric DNA-binding protein, putative (Poly(A+) rna-binding protein, putative) n=1 Tax=Candida maltosa (strain Xu316) TaxID=1245528 RepID=M3JWU1_CANMX|nr:Single-strand telomeric DNA-binding protein, putative (Poly(A+) rna-binding protein, putative) [Candida maltosa Xu316]
MEGMDIDDYSRDRSPDRDRSPVRDRSPARDRSPVRDRSDSFSGSSGRDSFSKRDYGYSSRSSYGGGSSRRDYDRGGSSGNRRDYSRTANDAEYRSKTERNFDNSIFIGNIPYDVTSRDIEDIFRKDFTIVRADIVTNRGQSRGMATVEFNSKDDVRDAISKFDRHEYRGREIFVRQDYPPPDKKNDYGSSRGRGRTYDSRSGGSSRYGSGGGDRYASGDRYGGRDSGRDSGRDRYGGSDRYQSSRRNDNYAPPPPPTKPGTEVFVGNLPFSVNWQALKDLMRDAGEVVRADVRLDNYGRSRGFGTVVFNTEEEANKAVEMFQGYEIEGRKLDTRPGRTSGSSDSSSRGGGGYERDSYRSSTAGGDRGFESRSGGGGGKKNSEFTADVTGNGEKSDTIYVQNLPFATQNDDLYELFETVGRTAKAEIQYGEDGRPSGNAVVQFEIADLAENAITQLNNYTYGGRDLNITYATRP